MSRTLEHPIISKKHKATRYYKALKSRMDSYKKEYSLVLSCSPGKLGKTSNPEELYIKILDYLSDKLSVSKKNIELEPETKAKLETYGSYDIDCRVTLYGDVKWSGKLKLIIIEGGRWG